MKRRFALLLLAPAIAFVPQVLTDLKSQVEAKGALTRHRFC